MSKLGRIRSVHVVTLIAALAVPLAGATVQRGKPADVGMSAERLARLDQAIERQLTPGNTNPAGVVTAVARRGRLVHLQAKGLMNIESKKPMATDSIFRLMSASKVVVTVAVLTLVEEGTIRLTDPVSKFIPEFANLTVAMPSSSPVRANRRITVEDLLTHTSGLGSGASFNESLRVSAIVPGTTLAEAVPRLTKAPLEFQPGDHWSYSPVAGFDTLLRIAEIVSGTAADELLRTRIFRPLGMKDTSFWTPAADKNPRLVTLYDHTPQGFKPADSAGWSNAYFSGAGGLMTTAEDFLQFGQMLLNGGELNGVRILSPRTVDLMHSTFVKDFDSPFDGKKSGRTFGLGVQIINDPVSVGYRVGAGTFGWDGALGSIETHLWVDPTEKVVGVVFLQGQNVTVFRDVENAVMQAIVD
jgi:CubicO group peptidase (beta-lactamase class C family)